VSRSRPHRRAWLLVVAVALVQPAACSRPNAEPRCRAVSATVLMAESVPSAGMVPCVAGLPDGWAVRAFSAHDGAGTFTLAHEDGAQLRVDLQATCVPADDPLDGEAQNEGVDQRVSTGADGGVRWTSTFTGGCVVETLTVPHAPAGDGALGIHEAIGFLPREELARELD
jgi:hypothetical protein